MAATESGMIDRHYPDLNLRSWATENTPVLTLNNTKTVLLRWDLSEIAGQRTAGYSMLELTPFSFYRMKDTDRIEFDRIRMVEIIGCDPHWNRNDVTFNSFLQDEPLESVLNTQMIHDFVIPSKKAEAFYIHLPKPVMQRMIDRKTKGLALYPLGSLQATFYFGQDPGASGPRLYYNLE